MFDLLVARCYPSGMNLREKLELALDRVSIKLFDAEGEGIAPIAIPRIIALKEKETARRGEILDLNPDVIGNNWNFAVGALERALEVMTERYGCYGERFVPFVDIIAPMAIILASDKFVGSNDQFKMLDKWYWRCVFSQYFISATETKIQRTVRQWLRKEGDSEGWIENNTLEPDSVKEFSYRTSILDDVSRVDNAVYRGAISLLLARKVHDFSSEHKSLAAARWEEIEDHHIYPKAFLAPNGLRGKKSITSAIGRH